MRRICRRNIVFIGNPGVGKSTLLNALVGEVKFKSGVSIGSGTTAVLQKYTHNKIDYYDSPGLIDIEIQKQAVKEIEKALRVGGEFKLFFVCTLEAGRAKAMDAAMIRLVLEAIEEDFQYSVIINKVTPGIKEQLEIVNHETIRRFKAGLVPLSRPTNSFYFYPEINHIRDRSNVLHHPPVQFVDWVNCRTFWEIREENVKDIEVDKYEKLEEHLRKSIEEINKLKGNYDWFPFENDNYRDEEKEREDEYTLKKNLEVGINFNDNFKVFRKLGMGAYATTYLCKIEKEEFSGVNFAVKLLKCEIIGSQRERLMKYEKLELPYHRNVVTVLATLSIGDKSKLDQNKISKIDDYEEFFDVKCQIIVMKCHYKRVASKSPFETSEVVYILRGLLRGITHLHKNHIVHRDLHCGNIFVDEREGRVWIGDFGCHLNLKDNPSKFKVHKDDRL